MHIDRECVNCCERADPPCRFGRVARRSVPVSTHVDGSAGQTLAQRLDNLFLSVRRPDGREYSHREVAEAVTAAGEPISHSYIGQLRAGDKDNPTIKHLRALARFFGVPVEYFTNEEIATDVDRELRMLTALKELQIKTVSLRRTLLPEAERSLAELARIVEVIREIEMAQDGERQSKE
ncbi:helix-turn-helix domain-containing protein [Micromonospora aurantiaca]|uniref:Helix-turn-helix domain-containing protein n=1 Tax=Micromonospora aurantiaca (nom. illeg.) TaxID=47850 RepID=A0A6N3K784_9ACTN|nr:helix-turn-helix domain-containing protein [Micromonospora aurantiaca]